MPTTFWGCRQRSCTTRSSAFGGSVRKSLGDGFLISFPSTVAAVSAAAAIERALHEYNIANPQRTVEIRIGLHVGQVAERDGDLLGQAVHVAARVMAEAAGGQILTSDEVRKHAEPQVDWSFLDSGLFWLRGFPERWRLYEVSWNDTAAGARTTAVSARLTPFVERDAERAILRRLVDDALAGDGGLALVAGEPGVGKSRLVAEIGDEAQARGMRVLTGHCVEMSGAPPYLPYVEIIEQAISNPRSPLALREALGDVAAEIARIAPALQARLPGHPAARRAAGRAGAPLCVEQPQRVRGPRRAGPAAAAGARGPALGRRVNRAAHRVPGAAAARDAGAGARNLPGHRSGSPPSAGPGHRRSWGAGAWWNG